MKDSFNKPLNPPPPPTPPAKSDLTASQPIVSISQRSTAGGLSDAEFEERFGGKAPITPMRPRMTERAKETASEKKKIDIQTGAAGFTEKLGRTSMKRQLGRAALPGGGMRYLGEKERKLFSDIVKKHATKLSAGAELPRATRRAIKSELESQRGKGILTKTDINALKKLVDTKM